MKITNLDDEFVKIAVAKEKKVKVFEKKYITREKREELLLKIISHYGLQNQVKKFNEEAYELTEAITENRFRVDEPEHIAEEIADCYVLLKQFEAFYNITSEKINNYMAYKIGRQLDRMENEKNGNN